MKQIEVVAAIIREGDTIFATQRGYGEFEGMWEFPGGKIEAGEAPEAALVREIQEYCCPVNFETAHFMYPHPR